MRDVVFTGPRLRVCYSGCRWNTVVFAMDGSQEEFEKWLKQVDDQFEITVRADPHLFRVASRVGPAFPKFIIQPSSNPELYSPELRCRLSTAVRKGLDEPEVNAYLVGAKDNMPVFPHEITAGSYMTPVMKLGYHKEGDNFGLNLTVLKAIHESNPIGQMSNDAWDMDVDGYTTGSPSSSHSV
jgi:hypothetical protein